MQKKQILVVGAGFAGAVFAREICEQSDLKVLVIDERGHIAGNCHTERDPINNIMTHVYGPHIFNTNNIFIWNYVQRFSKMLPYINRVKASISKGIFSLPINLHTINQFFGTRMDPLQAEAFIRARGDQSIIIPANFEEQALKFLGEDLYRSFFYGYTKKQWGCEPSELPAAILKRLPVRFNYDDNYYNALFQGIPEEGYTALVKNILSHKNIEVILNTAWEKNMASDFFHVIYTGCIDKFYDERLGSLGYRTVFWEKEYGTGNIQGNAVINYTELKEHYTRTHEHKHFAPWEKHSGSTLFKEYSKETSSTDTPYYPKRLSNDLSLLSQYQKLAHLEENISFIGRLGTYRYMDMEKVIDESIGFAKLFLTRHLERKKLPVFPFDIDTIKKED